MDNITHTLVGAALAEAGLKRRTALGAATLMIGANFPDIDVVAVPLGMGIEWRRGTTHGFLALAVLPFVLAGIMLLWDRRVRLRRTPDAVPADPRQLLLLSAIAIATHPTLDFMNIYGMRWLMPFRDQWFYADGLFIVDLWIFVGLVVAVYLSRRSLRPARVALVGLAAYVVLMLAVTSAGRARVAAEYPGRRFLVGPNAVVPWRRDVILEVEDGYRFGNWSLFGPLSVRPDLLPKGDRDPAVHAARQVPRVAHFLRWARFPTYLVTRDGGQTEVLVGDARYPGASWASVVVRLP
ncbi:MAG TPA: metal-dependent hydrolase [Gemmatimonadaceae bacterium]|nr:metal-dependent hydrolase [Gemmatimonadaceae bacterium]